MANWTEADIQAVWGKATQVNGYNKEIARKDECGAWIERKQYGNRNSIFGWEIDHISPGENDALSNLRPLQWKNNVDKSDGRLKCNVVSSEKTNIEK